MRWKNPDTAPKDGTVVEITGWRFNVNRRYRAKASWQKQHVPTEVWDFFPVEADGKGPYTNVIGWRPLTV